MFSRKVITKQPLLFRWSCEWTVQSTRSRSPPSAASAGQWRSTTPRRTSGSSTAPCPTSCIHTRQDSSKWYAYSSVCRYTECCWKCIILCSGKTIIGEKHNNNIFFTYVLWPKKCPLLIICMSLMLSHTCGTKVTKAIISCNNMNSFVMHISTPVH